MLSPSLVARCMQIGRYFKIIKEFVRRMFGSPGKTTLLRSVSRSPVDSARLLEMKMQNGAIMSAMRQSGNSISSIRYDLGGKIYSADELADFFEAAQPVKNPPVEEPDEIKKMRQEGMTLFKQADYAGSLAIFERLVQTTGLRKDWFNVFSAHLHLGQKDSAQTALQELRACPVPDDEESYLSPAEENFHVARLLIEHDCLDLGMSELLNLAKAYTVSIDDTFLYMRRVPAFGSIVRLVALLKTKLPAAKADEFVALLSSSVCREAREWLEKDG